MGSYRRAPGPWARIAFSWPWFLIMLLAPPVRSDKGSEELLKQADRLAQEGNHEKACYHYFRIIYGYPSVPRIEEVYHKAAIHCERGHRIDNAIDAREELIKRWPQTRLAKLSVCWLGQLFIKDLQYEKAAAEYRNFAVRFPDELVWHASEGPPCLPAPLALTEAASLHRKLGLLDKYFDDVELFLRNYGNRQEFFEQAAGIYFDVGQLFEHPHQQVRRQQHYKEYLKNWASKGGIDRQLIAEARLGEIAWHGSCPVPEVAGICIELERKAASVASALQDRLTRTKSAQRSRYYVLPKRVEEPCGPETRARITVYRREPTLAHLSVRIPG